LISSSVNGFGKWGSVIAFGSKITSRCTKSASRFCTPPDKFKSTVPPQAVHTLDLVTDATVT
jgi:hypothetical protein